MDMRRLVGRNVARLRRARGITQERLEELTGHSQQYLSDLERGRRNPTVVTLFELSQALGCQPADLVTVHEGEDEGR
ncbi:helix-turn-helix domain-containing protein [Roseomonas sp. GCM10028921]